MGQGRAARSPLRRDLAHAPLDRWSPLDDSAWRRRIEEAIDEACAIAAADGVMLLPSTQWAIIGDMDYDLTTSTARDIEAGRPSELDAIAGSVVRAGERLGVSCPALTELYERAAAQVV